MRWLIFLSRVAFLSGVFMLLALSLLFISWNNNEVVSSSVILGGYVLALITLPLVNIIYFLLAVLGKKPYHVVPKGLFIVNIIFLLILIIFIFYFNDPYYHQR
ncbi:MAG: hypothetical protein QM640_01625 [Niabella sp.]